MAKVTDMGSTHIRSTATRKFELYLYFLINVCSYVARLEDRVELFGIGRRPLRFWLVRNPSMRSIAC